MRPSGPYTENIDFLGKAVALMSEMGQGVTTIDGNQAFGWGLFHRIGKYSTIDGKFRIIALITATSVVRI